MVCEPTCTFVPLDAASQYICMAHGDIHLCGDRCEAMAPQDDIYRVCRLTGVRRKRDAVASFRESVAARHERVINGREKRKFSIKTLRSPAVSERLKKNRTCSHTDANEFAVTVQRIIFKLFEAPIMDEGRDRTTEISMVLTQKTHHMWHNLKAKTKRKIKLECFVVGFFYLLRKDIRQDDTVCIRSMCLMHRLPKPEKLRSLGFSKTYLTTASKYIREAMMKMRETEVDKLESLCVTLNGIR